MIKILIPESIPAYNKGEEAIFRGIQKTLEFMPEKKIYLYSENPEYDKKQYGNDVEIITTTFIPDAQLPVKEKLILLVRNITQYLCYACCPKFLKRKLFKNRLWRIYEEIDLVIMGHDNAFSFSHNFLILFFKLLNKNIVVYAATIMAHKCKGYIKRKITKFCLNKANLVTLREKKSFEFLNDMGLTPPYIACTADLAFLLDPIPMPEAIELLKENGVEKKDTPLVGMTVAFDSIVYRYGFVDIKDPVEKYKAHARILAKIIDFLIEKLHANVVFFPHSTDARKEENDYKLACDIIKNVINKSRVINMQKDYFACQLKGMIGCCDLFIGERIHSVIAALSMKVPSIVLSNKTDVRVCGIIGEMLGQYDWIYNNERVDVTSLKQLIDKAWEEREVIQKKLETVIPAAMKLAMINGELLKEVMYSRKI